MKWQNLTICLGASLTLSTLLLAPVSFAQEGSSQDSSSQSSNSEDSSTQNTRQAQQGEVNLSTTIIGNQEQPKVLYIVPWKAVNAADFETQTIRSQLDMVFGHVEPAEQRRELKYLKELANSQAMNNEQ